MYKLLIPNSAKAYGAKRGGGTIAGLSEVDQLDAGAIAVFGDDGTLIITTTTAATILNFGSIRMAVGGSAAGQPVRLTAPIDKDAFIQRKLAYVAPLVQISGVGQISTVGAANMGTITPNLVAQLGVQDVTLGQISILNTKRWEVVTKTGDTEAAIMDRMITTINADPDSIVTATANQVTAVTVGILLTAKSTDTVFAITLGGILANANKYQGADVAATRAPTVGRGTPAQIAILESQSDVNDGKAGTAGQLQYWWKRASSVETGATYIMYNLEWKTEAAPTTYNVNNVVATPEVSIAMPVGGTAAASFDTIFTLCFLSRSSEAGVLAKKA